MSQRPATPRFAFRRLRPLLACFALMLAAPPSAAHIDRVFACFVYIEPFEIRVEFVSSTDSMGVTDEMLENGINEQEQERFLADMEKRLSGAFEVRADDELLSFEPEQCEFVIIDPEQGARVDRRKVIPGTWSRVSGIFVCQRSSLPEAVEVRLSMYEDPSYRPPTRIPLTIEVLTSPNERETARFYLNKAFPDQYWALPPGLHYDAQLAEARATERPSYTPLYLASAAGVAGLGLLVLPLFHKPTRVSLGAGLLVVGVGVGVWSVQRGFAVPVDEDKAERAIESLLANVYQAFAYRDESKVFDTLATSVDGPLREQLYLDIRRGVSDAENGGPTVRVLDVDVVDCEIEQADSDQLRAKVRWVSRGSVSHWGHAHERANQYRARVVAKPVDGSWRLTDVNILEEERID
jgi:hypothetical protein